MWEFAAMRNFGHFTQLDTQDDCSLSYLLTRSDIGKAHLYHTLLKHIRSPRAQIDDTNFLWHPSAQLQPQMKIRPCRRKPGHR